MLWKLKSGFQYEYFQRILTQYSSYRVQGIKTPEDFSADLDKLYIPQLVAHKDPSAIPPGMVQKPQIRENLSIWDYLVKTTTDAQAKKMVLCGVPGSGKTKLLEYLTLAHADNHNRLGHPKAPKLLPVLLLFRQIAKLVTTTPVPNLAELINKIVIRESGAQLNPPSDWFQNQLKEGKCLVMLDGLDEIYNPVLRSSVCEWLDEQMRHYPETVFLVTSRPHGYINNPLKEAKTFLELQLFNSEQIEQFLKAWYQQESTKVTAAIQAIKKNSELAAIAANPLLLTMMALFEPKENLPKQRSELYDRICDCLLHRREKGKMTAVVLQLQAHQKKYLLQLLALNLMLRNQQEFTIVEAQEILSEAIKGFSSIEVTIEELINYLKNVTGLIIETQPEVYQFAHYSFADYLGASYIKETNQEKMLLANVDQPSWARIIKLYASMSEVNNLILAAWHKGTVASMSLAYDCCSDDNHPNPELQSKLNQWLELALESKDLKIASLAAQVQLSLRLNYAVVIN